MDNRHLKTLLNVVLPLATFGLQAVDHVTKATDTSCEAARVALYCRSIDDGPKLPFAPLPLAGAKLTATSTSSSITPSNETVKPTQ